MRTEELNEKLDKAITAKVATAHTQDWVLARWRDEAEKCEPDYYEAESRHGRVFVWMGVGGNDGWYSPYWDSGGDFVFLCGEGDVPPHLHLDKAER